MTDSASTVVQPGRQLFATRPWPSLGFYLVTLGVLAAGFGLGMLAPERNPWYGVAGLIGIGVFWLAFTMAGLVERHRVHEDAVVLGATLPGFRPYVIPLTSINPTSVTVHRRANLINRRLHQNGQPNMRMAFYSTTAVSFTGLHFEAARPGVSAITAIGRRATSMLLAGDLRNVPNSRWVLGVRDPRPLLEALEAALVEAGQSQPGLATHALDNEVVEPSGRRQS